MEKKWKDIIIVENAFIYYHIWVCPVFGYWIYWCYVPNTMYWVLCAEYYTSSTMYQVYILHPIYEIYSLSSKKSNRIKVLKLKKKKSSNFQIHLNPDLCDRSDHQFQTVSTKKVWEIPSYEKKFLKLVLS